MNANAIFSISQRRIKYFINMNRLTRTNKRACACVCGKLHAVHTHTLTCAECARCKNKQNELAKWCKECICASQQQQQQHNQCDLTFIEAKHREWFACCNSLLAQMHVVQRDHSSSSSNSNTSKSIENRALRVLPYKEPPSK